MKFTLICEDNGYNIGEKRVVTIEHGEIDDVADVINMLLNFLQAATYTYVEKIGVVVKGGGEIWTE